LEFPSPRASRIGCQRKLAKRFGFLVAVAPLESLTSARQRIGLFLGLLQRSVTFGRPTRPLWLFRLECFQFSEHVDGLCIAP
jgi:hypothetical protein